MGKLIYLDNAATTKTAPEVVDAMLPYFTEHFGNPSSVYGFAAANKEVITKQREIIAKALGAKTEEIYFTAGGSESDNWALKATAEAYESKGKHIITTKIEHHAILHTGEYLQKRGYEVTYLDVDENGIVSPEAVEAAIRPDTILVSVMFANNEIGSIQPIKEIGEIAHKHGVLFHTDAVQAFGQVPINVDEMNIDMLSSSGHKLNGPKGIGFLYIRKGVKIRSFIHGGAQERKRRAGTENVPGIVGYGKAVELAMASMEQRMKHETELRDYAIARIENEIKTMPNYFDEYDTTVHFISEEELKRDHSGIPHGGFVIRTGKTGWNDENSHVIEYSLKLDSNPEFTSSVIIAYARAAYRMNQEGQNGCKTVFDVAPAYLSALSGEELRKHLL